MKLAPTGLIGVCQPKGLARFADGAPPPYSVGILGALFRGTGRVALMALAANTTAFNAFGAGNSAALAVRRVGPPNYHLLKEITANKWLSSALVSTAEGNAGVPYLAGTSLFRPMVEVPYTDGAWSDGNGGAVDFPQVAATNYIEFDVGTKSTVATRLGIIVGYSGDTSGIFSVTLSEAVAGSVVPNLLPTAQQAYARGQISQAARDAIGSGVFVVGTSFLDIQKNGSSRMVHIPIADELPAGDYTLRLTYTGQKGGQVNGSAVVDRGYIYAGTYGTADMTHEDSGADLYLMNWLGAAHDGSTNDCYTLGGKVAGVGSSRIMGGGHGGEKLSASPVTRVDGIDVGLYAKTITRARSSNVATIGTDRDHKLTTGDVVTISGMSGTGYNAKGVTVTATGPTTLTYPNTGGNEGSTADVGGRFISHKVFIGTAAEVSIASEFFHSDYMSGATAVATCAASYNLNSSYLEMAHALTLAVGFDIDISTYYGLSSFWSGDRSAYGPEYGGPTTWKYAGTPQAGTELTADDNSETKSGTSLGYAMWSSTGYAAAVILLGYSSAPAKIFVQDRDTSPPFPNAVDKAYFRAVSGIVTQSPGYVISGIVRRYDTLLDPSGNYPAVQ